MKGVGARDKMGKMKLGATDPHLWLLKKTPIDVVSANVQGRGTGMGGQGERPWN